MNTGKPHAGSEHIEAAHFDQLADELGEIWWGSTTPAGIERLRRRARLLTGALSEFEDPQVLELGCGTGAFSQYILEARPNLRLHGIDVSPKSVQIATKRMNRYPNAIFTSDSALHTSFDLNTVDAVVGNSVLHHIPLESCLGEAHRILKSGGLLWFSEPNMLNPQIAVEKNIKFIGRRLQNTPDETAFFRWGLARALGNVGFREISVQPFDFLHPATPRFLMRPLAAVGEFLERVPLAREISGSLLISARK